MPPEEERARLVRQWLAKAEQDLQGAEILLRSPELLGLVAYHCQQAVEKAFKGFLALHDCPFRRTHDLTALLVQCEEVDSAFAVFTETARSLSPYAGDIRYPGDIEAPSPDQAATALDAARGVVGFVTIRVPRPDTP